MAEAIIAALMGPAGALILAVLILYGLYKLTIEHLLPIVKQWFEDNQQNIKDLMQEHKEDREAFQASIESLLERFKSHEDDIKDIKEDIGDIKKKLEDEGA